MSSHLQVIRSLSTVQRSVFDSRPLCSLVFVPTLNSSSAVFVAVVFAVQSLVLVGSIAVVAVTETVVPDAVVDFVAGRFDDYSASDDAKLVDYDVY